MKIFLVTMLTTYHQFVNIQLDVKTAFLYAARNEPTYLELSKGHKDSIDTSFVWKRSHSIYGLRDSPKLWNSLISSLFLDYGFVQFATDPCIYKCWGKITQNKLSSENHESQSNCPKLHLILYVDDITTSGERKEVDNLIKHIRQSFNIKTANEITKYVGYQVKEDQTSILLTQENYIKASAKRFRLTEMKQVKYPMSKSKNV
eukprot:snap_masked-scaffold_24-processed-gene-5.41-mRNA-1 protein AED:1.00 eAED:1.00 QI:0/-1/0/0/-1/1/1/0/202